jgi:hypothetical protein
MGQGFNRVLIVSTLFYGVAIWTWRIWKSSTIPVDGSPMPLSAAD